MKFVKERLKSARILRGHTQESLAELLGIAKTQIVRWESGKVVPGSDALHDMAEALNVSSDYLLGLTDDPAPHIQLGQLSLTEKEIILKLRAGEPFEAVKLIVEES